MDNLLDLGKRLPYHHNMTISQITAILYLLLAFGVPQPTVDTVHAILINSSPVVSAPVAPEMPSGSPVDPQVVSSSVPPLTITVNGSISPTLKPNDCIKSGTPTCSYAEVEWASNGVDECGIISTPFIDWAGNFGKSGVKKGHFAMGTTTVLLTCGDATTSAQVIVQ